MGCGKGYVVTVAYRSGKFDKVGGVEYNENLYRILRRNLNRVSKREKWDYVVNGDARRYPYYGDFNVFFFNNPFAENIMADVAKAIWKAHERDKILIYYLCHAESTERHQAILDAGFRLLRVIPDKREAYFTIYVYGN